MNHKGKAALAVILALCAGEAWAVPSFIWPVDCVYGQTCFIQNYVDRTYKKKGVLDHKCGDLTYDEHRGTDIRMPFREPLYKDGVNILAAADGVVEAVFNADAEFYLPSSLTNNFEDTKHFEGCGMGVMLDHGRGWKTLYCHLMPKSVALKEKDVVKQGQQIALMGETGSTTFPHLHFEIMHWGKPVDPFQPTNKTECDYKDITLWDKALPAVDYRSHGIVGAGVTHGAPDTSIIRAYGRSNVQAGLQGAYYFWVETFGLRTNDYVYIEVKQGDELYWKHEEYYLKDSAIDLLSWPMDKPYIAGLTATVTLLRGENAVSFAFDL